MTSKLDHVNDTTAQTQQDWPALWMIQIVGMLVALGVAALFIASLPFYYDRLRTICTALPCADGQLTPIQVHALAVQGLTPAFYATTMTGLNIIFAVVWWGMGLFLLWRKPGDRMALTVALMLIILGPGFRGTFDALTAAYPAWRLPVQLLGVIGFAAIILFLYTFPDGRFVPAWTFYLAAAWMVNATLSLLLPEALDTSGLGPLGWLGFLLFVIPAISSIIVQIYRYRRLATIQQRQQTKWVVWGIAVGLGGFIGVTLIRSAIPVLQQPGTLAGLLTEALATSAVLVIPLAIAAAILRHRLFDIDLVINRTLIFGGLTASVVGIYVLIVGSLSALFQTRGNLAIALLATGVVAVLFQPLRDRLQRLANRLLYGERDEPYTVVARLGRRLEAAFEPAAVLPATVATVAEALKLPYVAVALRPGAEEALTTVAAHGVPRGHPATFPLTYHGQVIGELRVSPRPGESSLSAADVRLLRDLAGQVGVAAHAVLLAADLERARLHVVNERDQARRHLGRDLHDGVGHQLAGLARKAEMAANLLEREPDTTRTLLADITRHCADTIAQVRGLAHQLHPPELELLGLVGALRERAQELDGLRVQLDAPEVLPALPAAVETAAYYIAQEALTNVQRHASARYCRIRLALAHGVAVPDAVLPALDAPVLELEIADDGHGLPIVEDTAASGLGLLSMRQRAAEVGGRCTIRPGTNGGTLVTVRLPVPKGEHRKDGAE